MSRFFALRRKIFLKDSQREKMHRRASRLNSNFKWTEKNVAMLRKLNDALSKKQEVLRRKMAGISERFSSLAKSEFPFLQGFKIFGEFEFCKNLPPDDKKEDEKTKSESTMERKWIDIEEDSWRHFLWKLQYDPAAKKFSALSNVFLTEGTPFWMRGKCDFELCGYLYFLLTTFDLIALQDLLECDENDWMEGVKITVNFPDGDFFNKPRQFFETVEENVIFERRRFYNKHFDWSGENVQKILEMNAAFCEKLDEMNERRIALHKRLTALAKNDEAFRDFGFDVELQYQNRANPTDIADIPLFRTMEKIGRHRPKISLRGDDGQDDFFNPYKIDEKDPGYWNFEVFSRHFSEEQKKLPFSYAMHEIFADGDIYSLEDLVRMKKEDWVACYSFSF